MSEDLAGRLGAKLGWSVGPTDSGDLALWASRVAEWLPHLLSEPNVIEALPKSSKRALRRQLAEDRVERVRHGATTVPTEAHEPASPASLAAWCTKGVTSNFLLLGLLGATRGGAERKLESMLARIADQDPTLPDDERGGPIMGETHYAVVRVRVTEVSTQEPPAPRAEPAAGTGPGARGGIIRRANQFGQEATFWLNDAGTVVFYPTGLYGFLADERRAQGVCWVATECDAERYDTTLSALRTNLAEQAL